MVGLAGLPSAKALGYFHPPRAVLTEESAWSFYFIGLLTHPRLDLARAKEEREQFLNRQQLTASGVQFLQIRLGFRLDVAANQRLGAAGAERDPFAVRQQKFVAVGRDDFSTLNGPIFFKPPPSFASNASFFSGAKLTLMRSV
jgi:hypothetical protein